jgi:long-chain acyl-CoA synthetase
LDEPEVLSYPGDIVHHMTDVTKATSSPPEDVKCIGDIPRSYAKTRPDQLALECGDRQLTFGELYERAKAVAAALEASGIGAQDRIAFVERNGVEALEVVFGAALLNAVTVNVNWRLAPVEMAQIINDAEAKLLIVGSDFFEHIEAVEDQMSSVSTVVAIGKHPKWAAYEAWLSAQPGRDPGHVAGPGDVTFQLYTSGTTGLPKGVMLTTSNFFTILERIGDHWGLGEPGAVNLAMMPMFHIGGLGWTMVGLAFGCRTVVLRDIEPEQIRSTISERGITHAFMVPAVIQMLLLTPGGTPDDYRSLRTLVYGASPISASTVSSAMEAMRCNFIQVYGLTETTGAITQLDPSDHDPGRRPDLLRSCGKPYPWVEIRIVDSEGNDAPTGEVGELWIKSGQNMAGYWRNPEATAQTITGDGWLRTGDAGFTDKDGYVFLHDRVKDMIVTGGENVYPAEVENVVMQHPAIADAAVIGVPDDKWGEAVKAVVVLRPGAELSGDDLIAYCRGHLGGFKCPKSVDFVTGLPRNPSGKLLKKEIRAPYWSGQRRQIG